MGTDIIQTFTASTNVPAKDPEEAGWSGVCFGASDAVANAAFGRTWTQLTAADTFFKNAGDDGDSELLLCIKLELWVPDTSVVEGIRFRAHLDDLGGTYTDLAMRLLSQGSLVGDNKAQGVWSVAFRTWGSASDDWNAGLTPADIRNDAFGVSYAINGIGGEGQLDVNNGGNTFEADVFFSVTTGITSVPGALVSAGGSVVVTGYGFVDIHGDGTNTLRCRFGAHDTTGSAVSPTQMLCPVPALGPSDPMTVGFGVSIDGTTFTNTSEHSVTYAGCGNGILEPDEECDDASVCCDSQLCTFMPPTSVCRQPASACDSAEYCTGTGTTCPPDALQPSGFVCAPATGLCMSPGTCDGATTVCSSPALRAEGALCRAAAPGSCDAPESCDGVSPFCPADAVLPADTVCANATACSLASTCNGVDDVCPAVAFAASSVVCRPSAGPCDVAETCTGGSAECPPDAFQPSTHVCAAKTTACVVGDALCPGDGPTCPPLVAAPAGILCRNATGVCDQPEYCLGGGAIACPPDTLFPDGHVCSPVAASELCGIPGRCDGVSGACPPVTVAAAGTVCRAALDPDELCEAEEVCDGASLLCPPDTVLPAGTVCEQGEGPCDTLVCDGANRTCTVPSAPADSSQCAVVVTRSPGNAPLAIGLSVVFAVLVCAIVVVAAVLWRRHVAHASQWALIHAKPAEMDAFRFYSYGTACPSPEVIARVGLTVALQPLLFADHAFGVALQALDACDVSDADHLCKALVYVYGRAPTLVPDLIEARVHAEVAQATAPGTLFRTNSAATKLMQAYARMVGLEYAWDVIGVHVRRAYFEAGGALQTDASGAATGAPRGLRSSSALNIASIELDANRGATEADAVFSKYVVMSLAQLMLSSVLASVDTMPRGIRRVCAALHGAVRAKFPGEERKAVNGFLFLRFLCPCVVTPESVGFVPCAPESDVRRKLTLVCKLLQNLANDVEFGAKEAFMVPLNEFIVSNRDALAQFVDSVVAMAPQSGARAAPGAGVGAGDAETQSLLGDPTKGPRWTGVPETVWMLASGVLFSYLHRMAARDTFAAALAELQPCNAPAPHPHPQPPQSLLEQLQRYLAFVSHGQAEPPLSARQILQ